MSVTETLQGRLEAMFTADTGATGLNNSASTAYVRGWFKSRHPDGDNRNSTRNWPYVVVDVKAQPMHSPANNKFRLLAQMRVYVDRQSQLTDSAATLYAVVERLTTVFDGQTPVTQNDWYFSPCMWKGEVEGPANGVEAVQVVEFETYASSG